MTKSTYASKILVMPAHLDIVLVCICPIRPFSDKYTGDYKKNIEISFWTSK